MILGVDARKLRDGGIGTYIRGTWSAIAARPDAPSLVALLDPSDVGRSFLGSAVREIPVAAGKYGLREHWAVPSAARAAGVTLLHAPHYTLPLAWRGPSVVTIHDLTHVRFPQFFPPGAGLYARAMAGAAARRARLVIADSLHGRNEIVEYLGIPNAKIRVIPLGVSKALVRPPAESIAAFRRERSLPEGFVLYVGARKRHKNLELLLQALARMPAGRRPPLVLAGSRWGAETPLARLAAKLGLTAAVHFAGDTSDDATLARLYAAAALYVQPSLAEGFGLPPLEAMACGTPVLSSDAGALEETVGQAAVTLPPREPERWAEEIAALLADEGRRAELSRRGLERAALFTWARTGEQTLAAFREVMGN